MFNPQVFQVAPTIWCVRRISYLTCSYVVQAAAGTVLIDAGMNSDGNDMRFALARLGLPMSGVKAVLLTHWHNDHAAGARAVLSETGAAIYYHAADAPFLTRETAHYGLRGWLSDVVPEWGLFVLAKGLLGEATPVAVAATRFVEDGETLLDDFEVIATPGHTPGHVSYYYRPERALFAGDAMAVVGGDIHFMARPVTPEIDQARASMRRCLTLDIERICPGHRAPLSIDVPTRCKSMVAYLDRGGAWPLLG